jgi:hypothetical protein
MEFPAMSRPEVVAVNFTSLRQLHKSNERLWKRVNELETILSNLIGAPLQLERTPGERWKERQAQKALEAKRATP